MSEILTHHAEVRLRQRGLRERDVAFVLEHGTPAGDAVLLTQQDAAQMIGEYRRRIAQLERLSGTAVFMDGGWILSVYRPSRVRVRRMLREGRSRPHGGDRRLRARRSP